MDVAEGVGAVRIGGAAIVVDAAGKREDSENNSNEVSGKPCHVYHRFGRSGLERGRGLARSWLGFRLPLADADGHVGREFFV